MLGINLILYGLGQNRKILENISIVWVGMEVGVFKDVMGELVKMVFKLKLFRGWLAKAQFLLEYGMVNGQNIPNMLKCQPILLIQLIQVGGGLHGIGQIVIVIAREISGKYIL